MTRQYNKVIDHFNKEKKEKNYDSKFSNPEVLAEMTILNLSLFYINRSVDRDIDFASIKTVFLGYWKEGDFLGSDLQDVTT